MKNNKKRNKRIKLAAIITAVIFAVILYTFREPLSLDKFLYSSKFDTSDDFIKFIDVGQADCALIYSNGYSALIDVGLPNTVNDVGDALSDCGIKTIDTVIISHLHSDHMGALPKLAEFFKIDNLIMPPIIDKSISTAQRAKDITQQKGGSVYEVVQGMNFNIGEFEITILSDFTDNSNENNRSIYVMAKIDDLKFLFTGDSEQKMEKLLLKENLNLNCDVLKVSHHGSNSSSSEEFIDATTPQYAVISVGEGNSYSHPHNETLTALKSENSIIYRTDKNGDITFQIDDGLDIQTEK